jgi:hypothetical protein
MGPLNSCTVIWRVANIDEAGQITADILNSQPGTDIQN